jgi:hypothetical protein
MEENEMGMLMAMEMQRFMMWDNALASNALRSSKDDALLQVRPPDSLMRSSFYELWCL